MIVTADIQSKETPSELTSMGRKGIIEWIWNHKVLANIPSTFLKSFLQSKKKIDAMSFYNYYKVVFELSQQVAIFKQIPVEQVSDADIFDEQTFQFLKENFSQTIQKNTVSHFNL